MEQKLVENSGVGEQGSKAKGEAPVFKFAIDQLRKEVPFTQALVITTLPRGSLQIAQPANVNETLLKAYSKEFHSEDRLSWRVVIEGKALNLKDVWHGDLQSVRYYADFLAPEKLAYGIAAPLAGPVLDGYPGALHLYRSAEQGQFNESDLRKLAAAAKDLDEAIGQMHLSRGAARCNIVLPHVSPVRQFVFNDRGKIIAWPDSLDQLDSRLREGMLADVRQRLAHVNGKAVVSDRVPLADSRGDLWNFRVVVHRRYPALGDGSFVLYCQQPDCKQWARLRPTDFQADTELARLVPAIKFMQEHYSRGSTLVHIAKAVHLSPFHFHRRFTELLGITPKHFLLDCQIEEAKRLLVARKSTLADIATACGFAHQSHFTSRFKQATGLTPTRWRRLASESTQHASEN
jgi:AraC-like DNA-binding protein